MKIEVAVVDCYGRDTEDYIELEEYNVSLLRIKALIDGTEVDRFIKRKDLKTLAKVL